MSIRTLGLILTLIACIDLIGCAGVNVRAYGRRGYYHRSYGPGPYWGWGGTVIVDRPIIVPDEPIAVPLPEVPDIPDMGMPDFGDMGGLDW